MGTTVHTVAFLGEMSGEILLFESFPDQQDELACKPKFGLCRGKLRSGADVNVVVANRTEAEAEFLPLQPHVLLPDRLVESRKEMSWGQVRGPLRFHLFPSSMSPAASHNQYSVIHIGKPF